MAALQRAHEALDAAVRNDAQNLNAKIEALRRAIDRGAAAGISEDQLAAAGEAMRGAPRATALAALHRAREALDHPTVSAVQDVDTKIEALRRAIDRCAAAGLAEVELDAARAVLRNATAEMRRAAALATLQHAHEALDRAVRGTDQSVFAHTEALREAIDTGAAAGLSEDQLAGAREAMTEAQRANALMALQHAREALESAIMRADLNLDAHINCLWRAIDQGVAAGLAEDQLAEAREAAGQGSRVAALTVLQRTHEALDNAVRHADSVDANIALLRQAVHRGVDAGLSEDQLAAAREATREAPRAAALATVRRAHEALDGAIGRADQNVEAEVAELHRAIDRGVAMGLAEDQLAAAREAMREAPRAAASAALRQAYGALHSATVENIDRLQRALDQRLNHGDVSASQLAAARETLREAHIMAALASVHRACETMHVRPRHAVALPGADRADTTFLHMNLTLLQQAINHAEDAGVTEDQLVPAREEAEQAAREQARERLNIAVTIATQCSSDRNISMLQRAIDHAAAVGAQEELAAARETLREVQRTATLQPMDECSICLEQEVTSVMPCCGREGSGNRICSLCLARHTEQRRVPCCPFCRAPL